MTRTLGEIIQDLQRIKDSGRSMHVGDVRESLDALAKELQDKAIDLIL